MLLVQLRSRAKSGQSSQVLSGAGWWTDTGTDTTVGSEWEELLYTAAGRLIRTLVA